MSETNPTFVYNDGGRKAAGYQGKAGDCVCRAISIAANLPYQQVYERLAEGNATQRRSKHDKGKRSKSARNGISTTRKWFKDYMLELGFEWTPTMQIGSGCKVHLKAEELPSGRLVCSVSNHNVAVIDGVINDTYDCSRQGKRCVYGYWRLAS
tara:strand:- start:257 stop:715 length:459 start_codon:yes stop_codon:yes gene_type:complete